MTDRNPPSKTGSTIVADMRQPLPDGLSPTSAALERLSAETREGLRALSRLDALERVARQTQDRLDALSRLETLEQLIVETHGRLDRLEAQVTQQADATRLQVKENTRLRSSVLQTLRQHDVRRELEAERALRASIERRRIEDLQRIRQLAEDRDALEIELQANAARHRREIGRLTSAGAERASNGEPATVSIASPPASPAPVSVAVPVKARLSKAERKALHAKAREAMRARDWIAARSLYERLVSDQSRRPGFWKQYAHAIKEGGDLALAQTAYFRALSLAPGDVDTAVHLAHVLKNRGDAEHAAFIFNGILANHPGFRPAREGLGDLGRDLPPAGPDAYPTNAPTGSRVRAWLTRRRIRAAGRAAKLGDWRKAEIRYSALLKQSPHDTRLLIQRGHALKEQGLIAKAEAAYREAVQIEPLNSDAHLHLGHILKLQGHTEAAMTSYRTALLCWPDNVDARHELQDT